MPDWLAVTASASGRPVHLFEKDIWVVWCLDTLFGAEIGAPLVFKGGTSLSKAYRVIRRFSEDVDLTYDIRVLAPDLVGDAPDALPPSRSQEGKWTKEVRKRLAAWVTDDAALHVAAVTFPTATPRVMNAERTFWEKATAAHVYCKQGRLHGDRFARHWYDLTRLAATGHAEAAMKDRALAEAVAAHKAIFFREKDADGQPIDYHAAVTGDLQLVPEGEARDALAEDYARMVEDDLLMDEAQPFDELMAVCTEMQKKYERKYVYQLLKFRPELSVVR